MPLIIAALALGGCQTLKTRSSVDTRTGQPKDTAPSGPAVSVPVPATPPQPAPQPTPSGPPTFLNKERPKVGLILGPGGLKAYAHLGVLREFAKARVPLHAIAGLEWGAVIGGLFAAQGQINDAEWKAFKLREQDLPGQGGFLSSRSKPQSIATLNEFLNTVFGNATFEKGKIDFACPAFWSKVDRFGWMTKGSLKDAMRACLPYPPLYSDNAGVLAAPLSLEEATAHLRSKGANLIILVNVLGQGEFLPPRMASEHVADQVLWSEIRREMLRARSPNVHYVINVNTSGHPLTDYEGRRALMESGSKAAADTVGKMVSLYGF